MYAYYVFVDIVSPSVIETYIVYDSFSIIITIQDLACSSWFLCSSAQHLYTFILCSFPNNQTHHITLHWTKEWATIHNAHTLKCVQYICMKMALQPTLERLYGKSFGASVLGSIASTAWHNQSNTLIFCRSFFCVYVVDLTVNASVSVSVWVRYHNIA